MEVTSESLLQEARSFHCKKRLGQHFLIDPQALQCIVDSLAGTAGDTIVEVGPGLGFLTRPLAQSSARVIAVDLDRESVERLREMHLHNVELKHGDFLNFDLGTLEFAQPARKMRQAAGEQGSAAARIKIAGNVPYQITGLILGHILGELDRPAPWLKTIDTIVLTVQAEVAQRMVAEPGSANYSKLSLLIGYFCQPQLQMTLPPAAFYPPPAVNSAIVKLTPRSQPAADPDNVHLFKQIIDAGFRQRRKMLPNALSFLHIPASDWQIIFKGLSFDPQTRVERLSLPQFAMLADAIHDYLATHAKNSNAGPAKVNLTFDILGALPDGYHQVETLMQAIDLQDDVTVSLAPDNQLTIDIHCVNDVMPSGFPTDASNLMAKAARLFFANGLSGEKVNLKIEIEKNIPIACGLAGGSADAAAVLVALNELYGRPFDERQLCSLGRSLGADVPFCIIGGTCLGTGRGDELKPIDLEIDLSYCIVKPKTLAVSTPWAYQRYDEYAGDIVRPSFKQAIDALSAANLSAAIDAFGNVFEPVIFNAYPQLSVLKQELLKNGAWCCHLSGSGPALFAIVADREQAHFMRRKFLKTDDLEFDYSRLSMPDLGPPLEFYIAQSAPSGVQILPAAH